MKFSVDATAARVSHMTDTAPPRLTLRQRWHRLRTSPRFPYLLFFGLLVAGGLSQVYCFWWDVRIERMLARCNGSAERNRFYPQWVRKYLGDRFVSHFEPIRCVHLNRDLTQSINPRPGDLRLLRGALFLRELNLYGHLNDDDVKYGQLSDDDVKHLKCLTQLRTVWCSGQPESVIDGVENLPKLTCLHLHNLRSPDATFFKRLASMRQLESLHFSLENTSDGRKNLIEGMRELAKSPTLRRLECQLFDDEFLALTSVLPDGRPPLPELREVRQSNSAGSLLTDRGLANLRNLPSLIHLDVRWSKVTDQGLVQLKELPFLRTLYLGNCIGITDEGTAILATMTGLESVNISQTKITQAEVLRVAALPRLRCLRATYYEPEVRAKLRQTLPVGCELVY